MESMETDSNLELGIRIQQVQEQTTGTIIDTLNVDCWFLIFDELSIKEILQTERTSKLWQKLVLEYLAYRPIVIHQSYVDYESLVLRKSSIASWVSLKRWLKKCGRSVRDIDIDCERLSDVVEALRDNCPNLVSLTLHKLKQKLLPTNTFHFQKLIWVDLEYCDEITDDCVSQFITSSLEDLRIINNKRVTGRFLNNFKSENNMNSLALRHCRAFKFPFLLSNLERFNKLTGLEFWKRNRSKIEIRSQLHLLLDRLPNLQDISFDVYDLLYSYNVDKSLGESDVFFESVCRLEKLHHLKANFQVTDRQLEAIANSCKEVAAVDLISNLVTQSGVDALCRHAVPHFYHLNLSGSLLTDDDVVACLYACPNISHLNLTDCPMLDSVVQRIAIARRNMREDLPATKRFHSLRNRILLIMNSWDFYGDAEDYKLEDDSTCWIFTSSHARRKPCNASIKEPSKGTVKEPCASPKQADQHTDEEHKQVQHTHKEPCASRELVSVQPVQLHEEYLLQADHGSNAEQDPLLSKLEQCRFCGEFSKECLTINDNRPYVTDNKAVFTLNGVSVKLDFSEDSLTRAVCRDCDVKLHDIVNFVNVVKATQDSLTKVADDYNVIDEYTNDGEDGGLEYVKEDIFRDNIEDINTPDYHSFNDKANGDIKEIKNRKVIKDICKASIVNTYKRKHKVDIKRKLIMTSVAKDEHFNDKYETINEKVSNDEVNKNIHCLVKVNTTRKPNDEKDNISFYFKANTGNKEIKNRKVIHEIFKPSLTKKKYQRRYRQKCFEES